MTHQLARLAAANAEAAYRFYSVNHDRTEAELWWGRVVYWQERLQELQEKRLSPAA